MASAAQYARAPTVPVGVYDAFFGKFDAPITNAFGTSQLCRWRLTTLLAGSVPITVPPVWCVLWYCVVVYGPLRGPPATCLPPIARAMSIALCVTYADSF